MRAYPTPQIQPRATAGEFMPADSANRAIDVPSFFRKTAASRQLWFIASGVTKATMSATFKIPEGHNRLLVFCTFGNAVLANSRLELLLAVDDTLQTPGTNTFCRFKNLTPSAASLADQSEVPDGNTDLRVVATFNGNTTTGTVCNVTTWRQN